MAIIKPEQLRSGSYSISGSFSGSFQGTLTGTSSLAVSSSFATTSSYAFQALSASYAPSVATNTGSLLVTASVSNANITFTKGDSTTFGITVNNVASASYALTSSFAQTTLSSSYAQTASYVETAQTASYILNAVSSSYSTQALSASYALTASYALNGGSGGGGNFISTGSISASVSLGTGSFTVTSGSNTFMFISSSGNVGIGTTTPNAKLDVSGSAIITGSLNVSSGITGSLLGTASYATQALSASFAQTTLSSSYAQTASYVLQAVSASYALSSSYALSASQAQSSVSASFATTSSYAFQALSASYATQALSASFATTASHLTLLNQQILLSGSLKFDPTQDPDPTGIDLDSTVLFQSSSNTALGYDLYVRQNGNLVKWKWIEGSLETGLLYGGVVTYSGSNVFVSPGSGIIAEHNATTSSEASPMIEYVTWNAITQSIVNIATQQVTYLYIDNTGTLQQQSTRFTSQQYHSYIPLGAVGHFDYTQISAFGGGVQTAYDQISQISNFIDAFGPLKMSGYGLTGQAGSLRLSVGSGTSFIHGGFYQNNPEFPSQITTPSQATASLARVQRSGSVIEFDTNAGNFYTVVDPTKYDRDGDGTLANVGSGNWSIQRVFSDPKTGILYVYYGQERYTSLLNALQFLPTDPFTEGDTFDFTTFVGFLVLKGNASNIADTATNSVINGGLFRGSGQGSGGGIALSNLEDLTDVTITSPINGQALIYNAGIWQNGNPTSASFATTASYVLNAVSASYATQALSSSFATSASYAPSTPAFPYTGSALITGSLGITGSLSNGIGNIARGIFSHAEGQGTSSTGSYSHAEGQYTTARGEGSHAEGYGPVANGIWSHAEGFYTTATGVSSHAEGSSTTSTANNSHAEGFYTTTTGEMSHAEGVQTVAQGAGSHAEGGWWYYDDGDFFFPGGTATGNASHAEGLGTLSSGEGSHAEGYYTIATGNGSHAEGVQTTAIGSYSHTEGAFTVAQGNYQHVQGQYNRSSSVQSAFIVGNGTSTSARSNLIFAAGSTVQITGSLQVSGSITGSLLGTSSFATSALTASYATQALTSSFATSALTASYALTSPLGKKITQSSTTLINQYQAPAGVTNTMVFSADIISTPGQIIDVDFLARNNSGLNTTIRVYVNSSATTAGATQIGNFTIGPTTDLMVRFTHRFVVVRDSLRTNNWFLIGSDALGYNTDIVYGAGEYFTETALGSATLLEKPFIIATLNQSGSLIAASINY